MSPHLWAYWKRQADKLDEPSMLAMMFLPERGAHEYNDRTAGTKEDTILCRPVMRGQIDDRTDGAMRDTICPPDEFRFDHVYDEKPEGYYVDVRLGHKLVYYTPQIRFDACVRCKRTDGLCTAEFCAPPRRKEQR